MLSSILQNQTFEVKHGNDAMTYLIDKRTLNGYPMLHNRDINRDHSIRDLTYKSKVSRYLNITSKEISLQINTVTLSNHLNH